MRDTEREFTFEAGLLVRKHFRAMLEYERFSGREIRWIERKGWLESAFIVRGPTSDVDAVASRIKAYSAALGET